jgi:3-isopropylmalate/(R)-2-methylmalate dehydratase large subunit
VGGKDLVLFTIGRLGVDGALYQSMEFTGETIEALAMDDRFSICNMAIEAGAKNGIIPPDDTVRSYCEGRFQREASYMASDPDAPYAERHEWDVSELSPQIAAPFLPSNVGPVEEFGDITLDQVVIGSCTNGRISDLRDAAEILADRHIAKGLRTLVFPATPHIYKQALREGLMDIFVDAGAVVSPPTCGPCLGGHMGVLAEGERALATTNRNFRGRMGHPESEVYLCNPAVAAASAITGRITHPADIMEKD